MDVVESTKVVDLGVALERELMECKKKCADLELEMKLKNDEFHCLEHKFKDVLVENLAIKEEVGVFKKKYDELEKRVVVNGNVNVGKEDVEEKVLKLMVENKALMCEKRKAESEVEVWKAKYEALELRVKELEGKDKDKDCNLSGKAKHEIGILETGNNVVSEVGGLKDGSSVLKCSTHLQAESAVRNNRDKVHSVTGLITSAQLSIEGIKNFYASGSVQFLILVVELFQFMNRLKSLYFAIFYIVFIIELSYFMIIHSFPYFRSNEHKNGLY